jgi:uncharacterized membrane protein YccC
MAAFVRRGTRDAPAPSWFDQLATLLATELAPTPRKFRSALRFTTIATIGAALVAICHVNNELGTYIIWLLVGAGPMMSVEKAIKFLVLEALALMASIVIARALAETPWLILPAIFALISFSTYIGIVAKLGTGVLLIQVVCLAVFYGVVFAPQDIGWGAAGAFSGSAIAFGVLIVFDNWLWPDRGEGILLASLASDLTRDRERLVDAAHYYFDPRATKRPALPPPTSNLPGYLALLDRIAVEGTDAYRHAILLGAVTRVARIHIQVDRIVVTARQHVPHQARARFRDEIRNAVDAIAAALEEFGDEFAHVIRVGADQPVTPARARAHLAMETLQERVDREPSGYGGHAGAAEVANLADFIDSLATIAGFIERFLDNPPTGLSDAPATSGPEHRSEGLDPALLRYSLKVGACIVLGYVVGIFPHQPELGTVLTTIIITALPTYGAALRKMLLRIVGAILGGLISLATIMIVTPNFETLLAYLIAIFVVFYLSAYASLGSGRTAYAGKQIGTTFALVFAGLSPSIDVYGPLWRIWAILLGTFVTTIVFFLLWPEYAGDSLLPRLRKVIRLTIALAPGGESSQSEDEIEAANAQTMRLLAEILEVGDDAQLEGRGGHVNAAAIVQATGNLRRIANRISSVSIGRIAIPLPRLDPETEAAREATLAAIRGQLKSWLDLFDGENKFNLAAARTMAQAHSRNDIARPLASFGARLEANQYASLASWSVDQRRTILAELQSMRRLEFLMWQLNRWLAQIPGAGPDLDRAFSPVPAQVSRSR